VIDISGNIGHPFFGLTALALAVSLGLRLLNKTKSRLSWSLITLLSGLAFLIGISASGNGLSTLAHPGSPEAQHVIFSLVLIICGLVMITARDKTDGSYEAVKIVQLLASAAVSWLHKHPSTGHGHAASWEEPYHRAIAVTFVMIAVLTYVSTQTKKRNGLLWAQVALLTLLSVGLLMYIEPTAAHTTAHADSHVMSTAMPTEAICQTPGKTWNVSLDSQSFNPSTLAVDRCDIVVFTATDSSQHILAAGSHLQHADYPGLNDVTLTPGQPYPLIITESGELPVHDHNSETLAMTIVVL
jgi:plastocyanin